MKLKIITICFIRSILIGLVVMLSACTQIDNYMLGKDNTPQPEPLAPLTSKVNINAQWSVANGKANKIHTYLKLKPVIQGAIIYTADASGVVQALNKNTGKLIWSHPLKHGVISGPTVSAGYVVVATNAASIVALKQTDGHLIWHAKVSSDVLSKVAIADHKVIAKTIDGNLFAFDLARGEKLWVADHGSPNLILKASSSPVVMDKLVLVGFSDGRLDAVDIKTGHVVWQRSIAYATGSSDVERLVDIDADPIIQGTTVYLATYQGYVGAMNLTDGQFIWNKPASIYKNVILHHDTLYMVDSDDVIWAIDANNGQVRWKQLALKAHGLTEPVLIGQDLVVGDKTGYVHLIATQNGAMIARTSLNSPINISPAVSGRFLYVITANGKLTCLGVVQK